MPASRVDAADAKWKALRDIDRGRLFGFLALSFTS
jgi:hypothetical protein